MSVGQVASNVSNTAGGTSSASTTAFQSSVTGAGTSTKTTVGSVGAQARIVANQAPNAPTLSRLKVVQGVAGAEVGVVTATDPDGPTTLTYTVSDTRFEIVGGVLRLKAGQALTGVIGTTVNLTITARDTGALQTSSQVTLTIADRIPDFADQVWSQLSDKLAGRDLHDRDGLIQELAKVPDLAAAFGMSASALADKIVALAWSLLPAGEADPLPDWNTEEGKFNQLFYHLYGWVRTSALAGNERIAFIRDALGDRRGRAVASALRIIWGISQQTSPEPLVSLDDLRAALSRPGRMPPDEVDYVMAAAQATAGWANAPADVTNTYFRRLNALLNPGVRPGASATPTITVSVVSESVGTSSDGMWHKIIAALSGKSLQNRNNFLSALNEISNFSYNIRMSQAAFAEKIEKLAQYYLPSDDRAPEGNVWNRPNGLRFISKYNAERTCELSWRDVERFARDAAFPTATLQDPPFTIEVGDFTAIKTVGADVGPIDVIGDPANTYTYTLTETDGRFEIVNGRLRVKSTANLPSSTVATLNVTDQNGRSVRRKVVVNVLSSTTAPAAPDLGAPIWTGVLQALRGLDLHNTAVVAAVLERVSGFGGVFGMKPAAFAERVAALAKHYLPGPEGYIPPVGSPERDSIDAFRWTFRAPSTSELTPTALKGFLLQAAYNDTRAVSIALALEWVHFAVQVAQPPEPCSDEEQFRTVLKSWSRMKPRDIDFVVQAWRDAPPDWKTQGPGSTSADNTFFRGLSAIIDPSKRPSAAAFTLPGLAKTTLPAITNTVWTALLNALSGKKLQDLTAVTNALNGVSGLAAAFGLDVTTLANRIFGLAKYYVPWNADQRPARKEWDAGVAAQFDRDYRATSTSAFSRGERLAFLYEAIAGDTSLRSAVVAAAVLRGAEASGAALPVDLAGLRTLLAGQLTPADLDALLAAYTALDAAWKAPAATSGLEANAFFRGFMAMVEPQRRTPDAPSFPNATLTVSYEENGTRRVALPAPMLPFNSGMVNYTISGADAATFVVNPVTGAVSFAASPNFERPGDADGDNVYEFTLTASNNLGPATMTVRVTVTDVVEATTVSDFLPPDADDAALLSGTLGPTNAEKLTTGGNKALAAYKAFAATQEGRNQIVYALTGTNLASLSGALRTRFATFFANLATTVGLPTIELARPATPQEMANGVPGYSGALIPETTYGAFVVDNGEPKILVSGKLLNSSGGFPLGRDTFMKVMLEEVGEHLAYLVRQLNIPLAPGDRGASLRFTLKGRALSPRLFTTQPNDTVTVRIGNAYFTANALDVLVPTAVWNGLGPSDDYKVLDNPLKLLVSVPPSIFSLPRDNNEGGPRGGLYIKVKTDNSDYWNCIKIDGDSTYGGSAILYLQPGTSNVSVTLTWHKWYFKKDDLTNVEQFDIQTQPSDHFDNDDVNRIGSAGYYDTPVKEFNPYAVTSSHSWDLTGDLLGSGNNTVSVWAGRESGTFVAKSTTAFLAHRVDHKDYVFNQTVGNANLFSGGQLSSPFVSNPSIMPNKLGAQVLKLTSGPIVITSISSQSPDFVVGDYGTTISLKADKFLTGPRTIYFNYRVGTSEERIGFCVLSVAASNPGVPVIEDLVSSHTLSSRMSSFYIDTFYCRTPTSGETISCFIWDQSTPPMFEVVRDPGSDDSSLNQQGWKLAFLQKPPLTANYNIKIAVLTASGITIQDVNVKVEIIQPTLTLGHKTVKENVKGAKIGQLLQIDEDLGTSPTWTVSDSALEVVKDGDVYNLKVKNGKSVVTEGGSTRSVTVTFTGNNRTQTALLIYTVTENRPAVTQLIPPTPNNADFRLAYVSSDGATSVIVLFDGIMFAESAQGARVVAQGGLQSYNKDILPQFATSPRFTTADIQYILSAAQALGAGAKLNEIGSVRTPTANVVQAAYELLGISDRQIGIYAEGAIKNGYGKNIHMEKLSNEGRLYLQALQNAMRMRVAVHPEANGYLTSLSARYRDGNWLFYSKANIFAESSSYDGMGIKSAHLILENAVLKAGFFFSSSVMHSMLFGVKPQSAVYGTGRGPRSPRDSIFINVPAETRPSQATLTSFVSANVESGLVQLNGTLLCDPSPRPQVNVISPELEALIDRCLDMFIIPAVLPSGITADMVEDLRRSMARELLSNGTLAPPFPPSPSTGGEASIMTWSAWFERAEVHLFQAMSAMVTYYLDYMILQVRFDLINGEIGSNALLFSAPELVGRLDALVPLERDRLIMSINHLYYLFGTSAGISIVGAAFAAGQTDTAMLAETTRTVVEYGAQGSILAFSGETLRTVVTNTPMPAAWLMRLPTITGEAAARLWTARGFAGGDLAKSYFSYQDAKKKYKEANGDPLGITAATLVAAKAAAYAVSGLSLIYATIRKQTEDWRSNMGTGVPIIGATAGFLGAGLWQIHLWKAGRIS